MQGYGDKENSAQNSILALGKGSDGEACGYRGHDTSAFWALLGRVHDHRNWSTRTQPIGISTEGKFLTTLC